jgi:hypothetical protein
MSNDSHLFADTGGEGMLPLYEAKLIHQFGHRWATLCKPTMFYKLNRAHGLQSSPYPRQRPGGVIFWVLSSRMPRG